MVSVLLKSQLFFQYNYACMLVYIGEKILEKSLQNTIAMSIHSAIAYLLETLKGETISPHVDDTALTKHLNSVGPPLTALEDQLVSLNVIYYYIHL